MCGIFGLFHSSQDISAAMRALAHRGNDAQNVLKVPHGIFGHVLHALTGYQEQPLVGMGTLLFNGQIYNWKELAQQENISASSDTEVLLHVLDTYPIEEVTSRLDGVYAFAYLRDNTLVLQRDLLGVKPLWYAHNSSCFGFASEPKALKEMGLVPRELHPRTTLTYAVSQNVLQSSSRPFCFPKTELSLDDALFAAVKKRIPSSNKVGVLFSGGVDSSLVSLLAKQAGADVTLYVCALDDPQKSVPSDLLAAREVAQSLNLPLIEVRASLSDVEGVLSEICSLIEDSSVIKVGVALPFYFAARQAARDGHRVLFSGLGAEEVFAGYQRHLRAKDISSECLRGLRAMHERDLFRDDVISMRHTVELRLPLLDHAVITRGLAIPAEEKIIDGVGKVPLRQAAVRFGLSKEFAFRPKKAAQYGSQFDAALEKLARRASLSKSAYLKQVYPVNARICALLSSGKDSVYALYLMQKMNYAVVCTATVLSENKDSYMYHTPAISFAKRQSESMGLPFLSATTAGNKEEELAALKDVLLRAIQEHHIDGVVSGALFSNYQRERIELVCEELGLQVFAPLWHLDQEMEVREILDAGFSFVLSKVAADGLDRSWVGRVITHIDVDILASRLGLNVAGEGGEYESLVINGPNFSYPLSLEGLDIVCEKEGSVEVCELVEKK